MFKILRKNWGKLCLLKVASLLVALIATIWVIFFITIQDWLGVFTESILVVLGYLGYAHTKHNNTKMIISLAHELNIAIIAEGV